MYRPAYKYIKEAQELLEVLGYTCEANSHRDLKNAIAKLMEEGEHGKTN
tara:strand:+ start:596 stop:742 length:147 start_codon:yes stop_codon:yes gene_type:complete